MVSDFSFGGHEFLHQHKWKKPSQHKKKYSERKKHLTLMEENHYLCKALSHTLDKEERKISKKTKRYTMFSKISETKCLNERETPKYQKK